MLRAMADSEITRALRSVLERISVASTKRPANLQHVQPRLVAVTKTKPVTLVKEAYKCGQRHFGENYVQELEEKGKDPQLLKECLDIQWHFIGHLQRNKVAKVLSVPNLYMVETIDNANLATAVNNTWQRFGNSEKLNVFVQVNTSGEENKHGCKPVEVADLVSFVLKECPMLTFRGLMTIGAFDHDLTKGPNPDFQCLIKCKEDVCSQLGLERETLELSMGMSNDFEHAIEQGSTNVRVGSTIFGAREIKAKKTTDNQTANVSSPETSSVASQQPDGTKDNSVESAKQQLNNVKIKDT